MVRPTYCPPSLWSVYGCVAGLDGPGYRLPLGHPAQSVSPQSTQSMVCPVYGLLSLRFDG